MMHYKAADIQHMIDVFGKIAEEKSFEEKLSMLTSILDEYPHRVIEEFLKIVGDLKNIQKDKYYGMLGYMLIRINLLSEE